MAASINRTTAVLRVVACFVLLARAATSYETSTWNSWNASQLVAVEGAGAGAGTLAAGSKRRRLALVNCIPYHTEILLGVVATIKELHYDFVVYAYIARNAYGERVEEAMALLRRKYGDFTVHPCRRLSDPQHAPRHATGIIYVSAHEDVRFHADIFAAAIERIQPDSVLAIVHNTDKRPLSLSVAATHPSVCLLGLSQLSHKRLMHEMHPAPPNVRMSWILPTLSLGTGEACVAPGAPCGATFTVQGNLAHARRDFHSLMDAMQALPAGSAIRLKLVGAAKDPPPIPADVAVRVDVFLNLGFSGFYEEIERSLALIPALASSHYLDGTKITSTVVTSLITGVPVIAGPFFIQAYSFLPASCFYHQLKGEALAVTLARIAAMSYAEHMAVRESLWQARRELQAHNMMVLRDQLAPKWQVGQ